MAETDFDRRAFLQAAAGGAAALAAITPLVAQAQSTTTPTARSTSVTYAMKPLPFDPQKIKGLSEKILVSHYENNYDLPPAKWTRLRATRPLRFVPI